MSDTTFVVEYIQTDPNNSPTPGLGHYAGERVFSSEAEAQAHAEASIGRPVPVEDFFPCCDWQLASTVVTGCRVFEQDEPGWEPIREWSV